MGRGPGVRAASASSTQIDFRFAGIRCREKLALAPTPANLRYAKRLKATIEHEIALGIFDYAKHFPNSPRAKQLAKQRGSVYTVREVLGMWLDRVEKTLQPETYADYAEYVRHTWLPAFGALNVDQLTLSRLNDWVAAQATSRKRILNLLTPLRQAARLAVAERILPVDPFAGLKIQRPATIRAAPEVDPFSPNEFAAATASLRPEVANILTFWVWTGLREGELLALQWPDIDSDAGHARISKALRGRRLKAPKTEKGNRNVPLLQPAVDALRRQQAFTRLMGKEIFLNPASRPQRGSRWAEPKPGPWTEKTLRREWQQACIASGVRYRSVRQLRHTFASWMLSAGERPRWVADVMGHEDESITYEAYGRFIPEVSPDAGQRAVAAVAAAMKAR